MTNDDGKRQHHRLVSWGAGQPSPRPVQVPPVQLRQGPVTLLEVLWALFALIALWFGAGLLLYLFAIVLHFALGLVVT